MAGEIFQPSWLAWPEVRRIVDAYAATGADICFVGGGVRDGLLGRVPVDYDMVTPLPMEASLAILHQAGISAHVLNAHFGMIQASIGKRVFDISPLADGGNDAEFTDRVEWFVGQYDFTMNALYCLPSGELFDRFGGAKDASAGRVRFIGDAEYSVVRRPIHIIRFFRFHATHGKGAPDARALAACALHADGIGRERGARIKREMIKLLQAPVASEMLELMRSLGILDHIFGFTINSCELVARLETVEAISQMRPDFHTRLIALLLSADISPLAALERIRLAWDMPDDSYWWKCNLLTSLPYFSPNMPVSLRESLLKKLNAYAFKQLLLLGWALEPEIDKSIVEHLRFGNNEAGVKISPDNKISTGN